MTSVERVLEYTELESEAPWETQKRPPPDWPSKGLVTFDRVSFSYSDKSPPVLHSLKAMFLPQEKVGLFAPSLIFRQLQNSADQLPSVSLRLVLWVAPVLGRVLWSLHCSDWQSLRETSTSMAFWHQRSVFTTCAGRCRLYLRWERDCEASVSISDPWRVSMSMQGWTC